MHRALALVAAVGLVAVVVGLAGPNVAEACFGGPSPEVLNVAGFSGYSDAIVVGEVVREEAVHADRPLPRTSTIRVAATLLGEPLDEVVLPVLGVTQGDCSGGPLLPEGERLLVFLARYPEGEGKPTADPSRWQIAVMGYGVYHLRGSDAVLDRTPLGDPEVRQSWHTDVVTPAADVIREVAAVNASQPAELDRALAFARGDQPSEQGPATLVIALVTGALGLALVNWWIRSR